MNLKFFILFSLLAAGVQCDGIISFFSNLIVGPADEVKSTTVRSLSRTGQYGSTTNYKNDKNRAESSLRNRNGFEDKTNDDRNPFTEEKDQNNYNREKPNGDNGDKKKIGGKQFGGLPYVGSSFTNNIYHQGLYPPYNIPDPYNVHSTHFTEIPEIPPLTRTVSPSSERTPTTKRTQLASMEPSDLSSERWPAVNYNYTTHSQVDYGLESSTRSTVSSQPAESVQSADKNNQNITGIPISSTSTPSYSFDISTTTSIRPSGIFVFPLEIDEKAHINETRIPDYLNMNITLTTRAPLTASPNVDSDELMESPIRGKHR